MKKKRIRNIILGIIDALVLILAVYFVIGYINFYKLSNDKEPLFVMKESSYTDGDKTINVYDNYVYKIVRCEVPGKSVSYGLRLWFMKDVD